MPNDGTAEAAAVERARKGMLHEGRDLKRTRIGADVLCEALLRQGVDVFFSYPGGVILPLYDVLGDYPELRHVLVRHEQGGAHAADGYARVTGRVGVCMGTSGPGATNLVTGIGTALLDSVPMVAITGNVPAALLGKDAFQEIDINGITLPMTKHNYLVRDADDLPRVIAEAFHIARTGRPGPVHVDITKDALQQETRRAASRPTRRSSPACPASGRTWTATRASSSWPPRRSPQAEAAGHPGRPRRPHRRGEGRAAGVRREDPDPGRLDAARASAPWTRRTRSPTATWGCTAGSTSTGRSRAPTCSSRSACASTTGSPATSGPTRRTPGSSTSTSTRPRSARTWPSRCRSSATRSASCAALTPLVDAVDPAIRADYFAQLADWRRESEASSWHGSGAWRDGLLSADYVVERIGEVTDHDATYVADVGQNQMWMARYTGFRRPNSHVSSGGLGTMGFGVPAAMGAALGRPDARPGRSPATAASR